MESPGGRKGFPRWDPSPRHVKAASQIRWGPAPLRSRKMTEGGGAWVYLFSADLASWHKSSRYRQTHQNPDSGSTWKEPLHLCLCHCGHPFLWWSSADFTDGRHIHKRWAPPPPQKVSLFMRLVLMISQVRLSATPLYGLQPTRCLSMGTLQARILEWIAISSSRGSSPSRDRTCVSCGSLIGRQILHH